MTSLCTASEHGGVHGDVRYRKEDVASEAQTVAQDKVIDTRSTAECTR